MIRSPIRSPLRSAVSSPFAMRRGGGASFSPAMMFASGELGAWYDPSDISTLFQDSAGTVPVTSSGQSVGRMLDKSGRGNHMIGASGAFPTYEVGGGLKYLRANGTTQRMSTASGVTLTVTDKLSCSAAVRVEGSGNQCIFSNDSVGTARFNLLYLAGASPKPRALLNAGASAAVSVAAKGAAPYLVVNTGVFDIAGATVSSEVVLRQDGAINAQTVESAGPAGTGNFSAQPFSLFSDSASVVQFPFSGLFYGGVIRAVQSTADELLNIEQYLGEKAGIFF
jgi:hypothetical protein